MTGRLEPLDDSRLDPLARDALARVRAGLGSVPAALRALAHAPAALAGAWGLVDGAILEGTVPRTTKLLVALAATAASPGAEALAELFRGTLEQTGVAAAVVEDLVKKGESGRLPERTQKVVVFGRRAALQPAMLADEDFRGLRREALTEPEVAELVALGAALAFLIALARAVGGSAAKSAD